MQKNIKVLTLKNNQTVILDRVDSVQSALLGIMFKVGSVYEEPELRGISHFIEHMMFKGTSKKTALEMTEDLERIGSMQNAFTSRDLTCYYIKSLSEHIDVSIDTLYDMLTDSLFEVEHMEKERSVIIEEKKMYDDSPDSRCGDNLATVMYKDHPYGASVIGTYESINNITKEACLDHIKKYYNASNSAIVVVGDFDEDRLLAKLESTFGHLLEGEKTMPFENVPFYPGYNSDVMNIAQTHINIGLKGVSFSTPKYDDMIIYSSILGGSMGSRLFQSLREKQGLCYTVGSSYDSHTNHGNLEISCAVANENILIASKAIMTELENMCNGPTEDELEIARNSFKAMHLYSNENLNARFFSLGKSFLLKGRIVTDSEIIDRISNVTKDGVLDMAKYVYDKSNLALSIVSGEEVDAKDIHQKITQ
jgi:predicted Zn-dependent peptidase